MIEDSTIARGSVGLRKNAINTLYLLYLSYFYLILISDIVQGGSDWSVFKGANPIDHSRALFSRK